VIRDGGKEIKKFEKLLAKVYKRLKSKPVIFRKIIVYARFSLIGFYFQFK